MIYGITFSDGRMDKAAELCAKGMKINGVGQPHVYCRADIDFNFYFDNRDVFSIDKGYGLYIWKPYIINDMLNNVNDGDIVVYSDAGVEFINNVSHVIDRMDQDIFLFGNMFEHIDWCKMECLEMMGMNAPRVYEGKQVQASVIFIRVSPFSRRFIKEWLLWCQMPGCIDNELDPSIQIPTFKEHRWDQAILTNLAIKHNIKLHYWPASYNNGAFTYSPVGYDRSVDNYPILFNHHRKRDHEW
jgi:hypothetical protein